MHMETPKVFESEYRFCLILWEHEPVRSSELVALCREQLGWKPTTTYTVIKRLSERGVLVNENSVVRALVTKDEVQAAEIDELVEKKFGGSLPGLHRGLCEEQAALKVGAGRGAADDRQLQGGRGRWLRCSRSYSI